MVTHATPSAPKREAGPNSLKISESAFVNAKVERLHSEQLANGLLPFSTPPQEYEAGLGVMPAFLEWMPKAPNPGRVPPAEAIELAK